MQKYTVNQYQINHILNWVQSNEIAIPEIQRPFVWSSVKVRDLMDSLYRGYPIGYIIAWKNPDVRLRDGTTASGKKVIIDGQQRITALRAAILGELVVNNEYAKVRIKIAFNPIEEKFDTLTPAIDKNSLWISDIADFMRTEGGLFNLVRNYCELNPEVDREKVEVNIEKLFEIKTKQIGFIELADELDIETVTEIFIRINSKGMVLSQADFAMSKIASYGDFGVNLRKSIDYFCHSIHEPGFYDQIKNVDTEFMQTDYAQHIAWINNESDDLYQPDYGDIIRVSFLKEFNRGKLSDLVSLLSGRNFETRDYEEAIATESFEKLKSGVLDFVRKTHYQRFSMIIKSLGFIDQTMIRSKNALNMAYVVYLKLRSLSFNDADIERYVGRWFVMSILTGRYSGSAESTFDTDVRNIDKLGVESYLQSLEESELSDAFWRVGLVRALDKSSTTSPYVHIFFASQIKANDKGFLSSDITVRDMKTHRGDIHHIFPKKYLMQKHKSRTEYNQIANFAYVQSEINIRVGDKAPSAYLAEVVAQCNGGKLTYGGIISAEELKKNLIQNCIPDSIFSMELGDYEDFLEERRKLMAKKIEAYYKSL